ncbi:hypothetical protein LEP3755_42950 [Leptolyngbya sp. NIES-3755]|nr:hypothetical protein LEP3755_42950 [Leptolyngbya sp. NIES-3755]
MAIILQDRPTQEKVLTVLNQLPPEGYLSVCVSQEQIDRWWKIKQDSLDLRGYLKAFFSGEPDPELEHPELNDIYRALRNVYVNLYNVLSLGWRQIKAFAAHVNYSIPNSPGATLVQILEDRAELQIAPILAAHHTISVKSARTILRPSKRLLKLIEKPIDTLNKAEKREVRKYFSDRAHFLAHGREYFLLQEFCINVAEQAGQYDLVLQDAYEALLKASNTLGQVLASHIHESQKLSGEIWREGIVTNA